LIAITSLLSTPTLAMLSGLGRLLCLEIFQPLLPPQSIQVEAILGMEFAR
jgi:hypothetical protein